MTVSQFISIKEYDHLVYRGQGNCISKDAFDELTQLINESPEQDDNDYGNIFWQRGEKLQARHFVGVIQTQDGTQIEILPKITVSIDKSGENAALKEIFLKMLREVGKLPYKSGQNANQDAGDLSLLEIFISDFLECVDRIVKRGIRSDYIRQEDNLPFMKGKLLMNQQIKYNLVHRERFYVEFDSFEANRPENRVIKSSLQKILKITQHHNNQRLARELLFVFDGVPCSMDYKQDFQQCRKDRGMHYYQDSLDWCRLILKDESPLPTTGHKTFRSFLFPMPQLFERYVEVKLRQKLKPGYTLKSQVRYKSLCQHKNSPMFQLKPDLLIEGNGKQLILDTKWKVVSNYKFDNNYGISQGDFYQMFAYGQKYLDGQGELFLIYPSNNAFNSPLDVFEFHDNLKLWAVPFDLEHDQLNMTIDALK
jgi:5-methylcytosine-specific restriction enzyme subunit McrC